MMTPQQIRMRVKEILTALPRNPTKVDEIVDDDRFCKILLLTGVPNRPGSDINGIRLELRINPPKVNIRKSDFTFTDETKFGVFCDFVHDKQPEATEPDIKSTALADAGIEQPAVVPAGEETDESAVQGFLLKHKMDVLGKWADDNGESTMELRFCHPTKKAATMTWTYMQDSEEPGTVFGLVGANDRLTDPKKPKTRDVAKRTVADGLCFTETGDQYDFKVVAEFTFAKNSKSEIIKYEVRISPSSKKDCPKHSYVLITCNPENPDSDRARLLDQDDNALSGEMKKMSAA